MLCGSVERRGTGEYMAEVRTSSQSERPCADIEETRTAAGDAGEGAIPPPFIETTTQESGLRDTEGAAKQKLHEPFERAGGGRA